MEIFPIANHDTLPDMPSATNPDHDGRYRTEDELASTANGEGAAFIGIEAGTGSPTVTDLQAYLDNTGSSGYFTGGILSDGGSGTLNVTAGEGFIRTTADDNAPLVSFKWSASLGIAIPDDTTQYVFVDDAGTISLNTDEFTEAVDNIMLGVVTDEGAVIAHTFNLGVRLQESIGQMGRYIRHVDDVVRNRRKGGLIFGESGDANRFVTVTAGQLEWGRTSYPIAAFNTSGADTFDTYTANGQVATGVSAWPNANYDDGTPVLATLGNNKWAVLWWYIEPDGHVVMLYGRAQYVTEGQAEDEAEPTSSIPNRLSSASVIASKFIFQEGSNTTAKIETAFGTPFTGSGVTAHNNLATLAWTSAGHTGTASTLAGFDGAGAAAEFTESDYSLVDGTRPFTGVVTIEGLGTGGQTDYDLKVGDTDGTPTYGMIQIGNACIGRTSFKAGNIDLDGAIIYRNIAGPVTSEIEHVFVESTGDSTRFALAKAGVGNATYNSRSMLIAGPAPADTDYVKVAYWQTNNSIFHNLVCDTAGAGADLGVQNDLEVEGDIFVDSIKESTTAAGITFAHSIIAGAGLNLGATSITGTGFTIDNAELIQVGNIGAASISNAKWLILGGMDQELDMTADVDFATLTITGMSRLDGGMGDGVDPDANNRINILADQDAGSIINISNQFDTGAANEGVFAAVQVRAVGGGLCEIISHGDERVATRYGITVADCGELLSINQTCLLIGTLTAGADVAMGAGGALAITVDGTNQDVTMEDTLFLAESTERANKAGYGQLWCTDNAGTTELWFSDDAGNDTKLA